MTLHPATLLPRPPLSSASPAGQGSVLSQEVDQLKRMLKAGANWEVISQMMSYISDKAAQVGRVSKGTVRKHWLLDAVCPSAKTR